MDTSHLRRAEINTDILTGWKEIDRNHVVKGDHVRFQKDGTTIEGIVEPRRLSGQILTVIGCVVVGDESVIDSQSYDVTNTRVERAQYSKSVDSKKSYDNANKKIGRRKPLSSVTHQSNFAMFCATGLTLDWKGVYLIAIEPGDHLRLEGKKNVLVKSVCIRLKHIECFVLEKSSTISVHTIKNPKKIEVGVYNTCCSKRDSITVAKGLMESKERYSNVNFDRDLDFVKYCRLGHTACVVPLPSQIPEDILTHNVVIVPGYVEKDPSEVFKGDHISREGQKHYLVVGKNGCKLDLIHYDQEESKVCRIRQSYSSRSKYRVYKYTECTDSGSTVSKAISLLNEDFRSVPATNDFDFVMLCKRGCYVSWKPAFINELCQGDHIRWVAPDINHHAIVEHATPSKGVVVCYQNTLSGIKRIEINRSEFEVAVYNASYDRETVLRRLKSRLPESKYNLLDHTDRHFAEWCMMGMSATYFTKKKKEADVVHKELVLSADMLQPGDQIAWTRIITHDHHALVIEVTGKNEVLVYEFTQSKGETGFKTIKTASKIKIFDGSDPVYKIIHTPPQDPKALLKAAEKQVNKMGGYNLFSNNCENYAANKSNIPAQVKGFFIYIGKMISKLLSNFCPRAIRGWVDAGIETVERFFASSALTVGSDVSVREGLKILARSLHIAALFVPVFVEICSIIWDTNHDWADNKKTRISVGLSGTGVTTALMVPIALPVVTIGVSIGYAFLALAISFLGYSLTTLTMRLIRRHVDKKLCEEAFSGLY